MSTIGDDLKTLRDELKLRVHLGSRDLQDAFAELEGRWSRFEQQAELDRTASNLGEAAKLLGAELKEGYERIRKAL